jgi:precorrin-8X/cobalt-precorrin-8 methylmutase
MLKAGIVILAHGSRGERGTVEVPETLKKVTESLKTLLPSGVEIAGAALRFNHPSLKEAVEALILSGVNRIVILPYFLFSGRHITEDIPHLMEMLESQYPEVQFTAANTLGNDELFVGLVVDRIQEAAPELWSNSPVLPVSPEAIEKQSMEIVERLLPSTIKITGEERLILKRVVHASGDPQVASLMKFSPSALTSGINAIAEGSPIFTDVRMVAAGINRRLAEACSCSVSCAIEEVKGQEQLKRQNITRAAAAMHHLGKRLNGAIVVIGNAPTALLALLELIDNDGVKPALIVGMPVGFVQARESKEELIKREVPYVTIVGTRGGSAMAVATINALLKIAWNETGIISSK